MILPFRKQKISQVGFVRLAVIRLEALGLNFILLKPAFKASTTMIGFEGMFTSAHGSAAGRAIQWLKFQLLSLLELIMDNTS